jgi:Tol biopolymer transport system component
MLKKLILIIVPLCLTFTSSAGARVYLDINAPTLIQIPIVLSKWKSVGKTPATLSEKVYEILANDLTLSGFFG